MAYGWPQIFLYTTHWQRIDLIRWRADLRESSISDIVSSVWHLPHCEAALHEHSESQV